MRFPNEHPTHVARRMEGGIERLTRLEDRLAEIDPTDADGLRQAMVDVVGEMKTLALATGILCGRAARGGL